MGNTSQMVGAEGNESGKILIPLKKVRSIARTLFLSDSQGQSGVSSRAREARAWDQNLFLTHREKLTRARFQALARARARKTRDQNPCLASRENLARDRARNIATELGVQVVDSGGREEKCLDLAEAMCRSEHPGIGFNLASCLDTPSSSHYYLIEALHTAVRCDTRPKDPSTPELSYQESVIGLHFLIKRGIIDPSLPLDIEIDQVQAALARRSHLTFMNGVARSQGIQRPPAAVLVVILRFAFLTSLY